MMRGVKKVVPWIVLVVGFAVTGYAMVNGFRDFVSSIEPGRPVQAPGAETVAALPAGNWVIFQQTDARSGGSGRGSGGTSTGRPRTPDGTTNSSTGRR